MAAKASKPAADAAACCRCRCDWPTNRMMNLCERPFQEWYIYKWKDHKDAQRVTMRLCNVSTGRVLELIAMAIGCAGRGIAG